MRAERLLSTLGDDRLAFGMALHLRDPAVIEILAIEDYDWVSIILEHASLSVQDIAELQLAADARGITTLVHVAHVHDERILPLLNAGVGGIVAPKAESAEDAMALVEVTRFPPLGDRGAHGVVRSAEYGATPYPTYVAEIDKSVMVGVIIESELGVDNVDAILAVEGIDLAYIGLADLSQSLGVPGQVDHERVRAAIERVAEAARGTDVVLATSDYGLSAERVRSLGVGMVISPTSDYGFIRTQFREHLAEARARLGQA